jgi:maltooligosyltrehalose trehalohydrolase
MIDLKEVSASGSSDDAGHLSLRFGIYLPGVRASDGFKLLVRIIHQTDRFDPLVAPVDVELAWQSGTQLDLWTVTTSLQKDPHSHYGQDGLYCYRYQLWHKSSSDTPVTTWATDPFAHQTDVGLLAAVPCSKTPVTPFKWSDDTWKTPELDDLVVYELHIGQFNETFDGIIDRIGYLKSIGVNCLELMPLTTTKLDYDWGYGPIHYFAPNPEYGGPDGLKRLVEACHKNGVAVILDLVYQHVDPSFPYNQIYADIIARGISDIRSPMIGQGGQFGPQVDFSQTFAQEYFKVANQRWLDEFHVDGFRYDEVTDLFKGPTDTAYALLSYETYMYSRSITRFGCGPGTYSRLIQTAEALDKAPTVLRNTYTNAAWQDELLNDAEAAISKSFTDTSSLTDFAHTLDPYFAAKYPATKTVVDSAGDPTEMPVAPFQYLNTHDHSHLICFAGVTGATGPGLLPAGDRSQFYKLQPFAIALYTCQGVPMLWEGEEFADNYNVSPDGAARVNLRRDTNWDYFYDDPGRPLVRLYRILGMLRRECPSLRSRESFFYFEQSLQGNSIVAYHRHAPAVQGGKGEQYAMVLLNFGPSESAITLPFPKAGNWAEKIDGGLTVDVSDAGSMQTLSVPSWYGYVFIL